MNIRVVLLISALVLAGGALRLYNLTYQSLWYDEIHTILRSSPATSLQSIIGYAEGSEVDQPPVFFLYTKFIFEVFGFSEATVRFGSVLLGIFAIPVMYFLGREFVNSESGVFAAALTTVNYFHIYYSQEARFYTMTFLLSALSYLFLVRAVKKIRPLDFALYSLSTILLLYTHYFGMIIFATQVLTFVVLVAFCKRNERRFIVSGLVSGLLIIASFLPWLSIVLKHSQVGSFWIQKPNLFFLLDYFYNYFGKDILQTLILAGLTFLFVRHLLQKDVAEPQRQLYIILVLWLLVSYLIPFLRSVMSTPIMHIRYTIITLPAWIIIFSVGWSTLKSRRWKRGLVTALIVLSVVNLVFFRRHYTKIQKQQMREAAAMVQQKNEAGTPVYSIYPEHFQYYFGNAGHIGFAEPAQLLQADRFWLLQAQFFSADEYSVELKQFEEAFEVVENHQFHKTAAVLLVRRDESTAPNDPGQTN